MAPYCKQYRAIPVWMEYWSSLSHTRAIPQFFVTGSDMAFMQVGLLAPGKYDQRSFYADFERRKGENLDNMARKRVKEGVQ